MYAVIAYPLFAEDFLLPAPWKQGAGNKSKALILEIKPGLGSRL
jgi:hypothetical protein